MATIITLLRQSAPRLTRKWFARPHRCSTFGLGLRSQPIRTSFHLHPKSRKPKTQRSRSISAFTQDLDSFAQRSSPLGSLGRSLEGSGTRTPHFSTVSSKAVAYWLLGSAASVFGIVVFGGLTRLTESGLSITEWKPVTGSLPPRNAQDWDSEFAKYRSSPEFQRLNPHMSLDEFKSIYYMEWIHRQWGRFVGLSFALPAIYFIARGRVSRKMALKITGIAVLIGFQGFLGWWMVKSGLKDDLFAPGSHPRVSQYRLVAHLGTAFIAYSAMLWNGLLILRTHKLLGNLEAAEKLLLRLIDPKLGIFRKSIGALAVLVFITAMSGGLVAGLDAGLIYNEFPWMGTGLSPPVSELFSDFYSHTTDGSDTWWRNSLENPSLVQLDHRVLATTTFSAIMALFAYSRVSPTVKSLLPAPSRKAMHGVFGFACLQVALGVSTLIYLVPLPLASAHQAGSLALLSYVIVLGSRTWVPNRTIQARLVRRFLMAKNSSKPARVDLLHKNNNASRRITS